MFYYSGGRKPFERPPRFVDLGLFDKIEKNRKLTGKLSTQRFRRHYLVDEIPPNLTISCENPFEIKGMQMQQVRVAPEEIDLQEKVLQDIAHLCLRGKKGEYINF